MLRNGVAGLILVLAMAMSTAALAAQDSGDSLLTALGYSEVVIGATEAGYEVPESIEAGTYLVTLDNQAPFEAGFSFIRLPEGMSPADILAEPPEGDGESADDGETSEQGGEGLPSFLYMSTWAGGVFAPPGEASSAVISLGPGEWIMLGPPDVPLPPAVLLVTGEADPDPPAVPEGSVEIELVNFQIHMPEVIPAGNNIWSFTNDGDQMHEFYLVRTGERWSPDDAVAVLFADPEAEPDPALPSVEEIELVAFGSPITKGQGVLLEINLEPGAYLAVCFLPEAESGNPHAMHGMVVAFSVGAEGEEVEPPASPEPID